MKVLFVLDAVKADRAGGIAHSAATEIDELVARGHAVRVLTRMQQAGTPELETLDGVEVRRVRGPSAGAPSYYLHPAFTRVRGPGAFRRLYAAWPFDVAYVHNAFHASAYAAARLPAPSLYSFHASASEEIAIDLAGGKYRGLTAAVRAGLPAVAAWERRALGSMDRVFARSAFMKTRLDALAPAVGAGAEIVPLMVDTNRFPFRPSGAEARRRLGLPAAAPILLCVRRLVPRMGLEALVEAAELWRRERPEVLTLIGGRGPLEGRLAEQVRERGLGESVRLLGFVSEEELPDYYAAADLFVLPTAQLEGFGLVTLEAMSTGRATVATPVGGSVEVVGGFDSDLLTEDPGPEAIARAVLRWLEPSRDPALRARVAEHAENVYSRQQVGGALEALLDRTAGRAQT